MGRILRQSEQFTWRTAAFDNELVNRLDKEFHQWWKAKPARNGDRFHDHAQDDWEMYGDPDKTGIAHWLSIESFLKDNYPEAHRGLDMGLEQAKPLMDGKPRWSPQHKRYETGPEAEAQYGYDPKEVAAGMLLLHNQAHGQRTDAEQGDVDRLNDIAQKRFTMQRNYEQRQPITAALDLLRMANRIVAMPYYHNTDAELNSGDELLPAAERGYDSKWKHVPEYDPNSVYFSWGDNDDCAETDRGKNRYEVEPIGKVQQDPEHLRHVRYFEKEHGRPWDADLDADEDVMQNSYKAPRARVVRKLPFAPWQWTHPDHPKYDPRFVGVANRIAANPK